MKRMDLIPYIHGLGLNNPNLVTNLIHETVRLEGMQMLHVNIEALKVNLKFFIAKLKPKLQKCNNTWPSFLERENEWIEGPISQDVVIVNKK